MKIIVRKKVLAIHYLLLLFVFGNIRSLKLDTKESGFSSNDPGSIMLSFVSIPDSYTYQLGDTGIYLVGNKNDIAALINKSPYIKNFLGTSSSFSIKPVDTDAVSKIDFVVNASSLTSSLDIKFYPLQGSLATSSNTTQCAYIASINTSALYNYLMGTKQPSDLPSKTGLLATNLYNYLRKTAPSAIPNIITGSAGFAFNDAWLLYTNADNNKAPRATAGISSQIEALSIAGKIINSYKPYVTINDAAGDGSLSFIHGIDHVFISPITIGINFTFNPVISTSTSTTSTGSGNSQKTMIQDQISQILSIDSLTVTAALQQHQGSTTGENATFSQVKISFDITKSDLENAKIITYRTENCVSTTTGGTQ